jgi:hypothetical protein
LREGHTLRMLGNMLLRKTFESRREEGTGGFKKLHKEYLHDLYFLSNLILFE